MSEPAYRVTEGVSGVWHYHLSPTGKGEYVRGLCGAPTMITSIPLEGWGEPGPNHLPKRYTWCKECERLKEHDDETVQP